MERRFRSVDYALQLLFAGVPTTPTVSQFVLSSREPSSLIPPKPLQKITELVVLHFTSDPCGGVRLSSTYISNPYLNMSWESVLDRRIFLCQTKKWHASLVEIKRRPIKEKRTRNAVLLENEEPARPTFESYIARAPPPPISCEAAFLKNRTPVAVISPRSKNTAPPLYKHASWSSTRDKHGTNTEVREKLSIMHGEYYRVFCWILPILPCWM